MQMKIGAIGAGVGIPRTDLQVSALNIVKFYLRHGLYDPTIINWILTT